MPDQTFTNTKLRLTYVSVKNTMCRMTWITQANSVHQKLEDLSVCRQQLPVPLLLPMISPDHTAHVHMWRMVSCLQLQSTQWCALNGNSLNASESLEHYVTLTNNFWAEQWVISNIMLDSEVIAQPFFPLLFYIWSSSFPVNAWIFSKHAKIWQASVLP